MITSTSFCYADAKAFIDPWTGEKWLRENPVVGMKWAVVTHTPQLGGWTVLTDRGYVVG